MRKEVPVASGAILENNISCLGSFGERSLLAAFKAHGKFSYSLPLPHKLHRLTKIPVQLNQWNVLTELWVFLHISNPFLRGTVLLKGS